MRAGYSLLEVLMAVALIALAAAVSFPAVISGFERYERRQALSQVRASLIDLRTRAVLDGRPVTLEADAALAAPSTLPEGWRAVLDDQLAVTAAGLCERTTGARLHAPRGRVTRLDIIAPGCDLQL